MIRVRLHNKSTDEVFPALAAEWRQLFGAAGCSPFLSWEWLSVWFESFGDGKTPFILTAHRDEKLVGILPLFLEQRKRVGMSIRQLAFMGTGMGGADYLDLISPPGDRAEVMSAMITFLWKESGVDSICFENIADDSVAARYSRQAAPSLEPGNVRISESIAAVCPQIDLSGGWQAVLTGGKRASNFTRKLKKLEKMPGFEFRSVTSPAETGDAFERFLRLHENRWAGEGGSELSGHPRLVSFQRRLVPALASAGLIRFDELWVDGECRSSIYGLDDGPTFYYYNSGFDPQYASASVGLVLLGLSVKNAIGRGNVLYDFLRGDETYKFDWANRQTKLVTVNLNRNTFPLIADEGIDRALLGVKSIAKAALPAGIAETLKTWRRARRRIFQLSDR